MRIAKGTIRFFIICLIYLIDNVQVCGQAGESQTARSNLQEYSLQYTNDEMRADTLEAEREKIIMKYEEEKVDPTTAGLLNWLTGPLVAGHYYANAGPAALKYHIMWGLGITSGVLAVNTNSDTWAYLCAGLIAYAWVYSSFEAPALARTYNMNWRKEHGLTKTEEKFSKPYTTIVAISYEL